MKRGYMRYSFVILLAIFAVATGLTIVACEEGANSPTATETPARTGDGGPLALAPGGELTSESDDSSSDDSSDDSGSDDSSSDDSSAAAVDCVVLSWGKCSAVCDGVQLPFETVGPENGGAPCPESRPCGLSPPCEP